MRRREFIVLGGAALCAFAAVVVWPLRPFAQQPVVGFLNSASAEGYASMAAAFKKGAERSWLCRGQNVAIEYRWADNQYERLPALSRTRRSIP
jgi:hypothetical protein